MADNKAKSKDLNQIVDDFVKERLRLIIFNAKKQRFMPDFWRFLSQKTTQTEMLLTPHSSITPCKSMVLRPSDYRITGLQPKLWTPPSEALNFLIFMIIYKYLYI